VISPFAPTASRVEVGVADVAGDGHGVLLAGTASGDHPRLAMLDPLSGATLRSIELDPSLTRRLPGLRLDGAGINVALATRLGFPVTASPQTTKLKARKRRSVAVAWFRDASRSSRNDVRVAIDWGDGTSWNGRVVSHGGGLYEIRSRKRYARAGRYAVTATWRDGTGRTSIARSRALVSRR
jgi:hypothetical protein